MKKIANRDTAMGVYLSTEQINPTMRAWSIGNISGGRGSDVNSNLDFIDRYARLVGVRAEDVSKKETLDEKIIDALKVEKAFEFKGRVYVPVSKDLGFSGLKQQ